MSLNPLAVWLSAREAEAHPAGGSQNAGLHLEFHHTIALTHHFI